MTQAQREMDAAVGEWLEAYRGHERYLAATESLFTAFARSWQGSPRYIAEAFTDFRAALMKEHGFKHLEVVKALSKEKIEIK